MLVQIAEWLGPWSDGEVSVAWFGQRTFAIVAVRNTGTELSALAREVIAEMRAPGRPLVHQ
jgi:hypothetical protein